MNDSSPGIDELARRIERTMLTDRRHLQRSLTTIQRRHREGKPNDRALTRLLQDLERSEQKYQQRASRIPASECDPLLPIAARSAEIAATIREHPVVIVAGETGSGKSTQLPKICLQAGRGVAGMIGHTQPRRIAARSVAARLAEELGTRVGDVVAFKIRFTDTTSAGTYVKLMTDGILLAETRSDRFLNQYDTLIIDEAHERSLNIDFLLGYLKRLLSQRPDLRVIITSATIDAARFAEYFGSPSNPAPVIEVSGRVYPVDIRWRPPALDEEEEVDWQRSAADACEELALEGPGDMLVFMPTERDIRETVRVLQGRSFAGERVEVLPLFGRLSEGEQNRIFQSHSARRIIVATNVAESSLTVPGIRFVVDPGLARISRFSPGAQVQRLPIEAISRASASQRAGRCGRVGPGICVRLYSAEDFTSRDEYTPPEILRTNLASVLLQMKALDLGRFEDFPFLDPPQSAAIRSGLRTLNELNAIDEAESLTKLGRAMSRLPVDPRIARMILAGADEHCLADVLVVAAALELRDPRDRPLNKQKEADQAHQKFQHERSDFLSLLKLWDFYAHLEETLSTSRLRKACQQNFLSYNRMREWKDLHRQLRDIVTDHGYRVESSAPGGAAPLRDPLREDAFHRALLSGLLSHLALRGEGHEYTGAGGQKLFLWPGSIAFSSKPKWIMAAELVETTRRFARTVAPVKTQWIEPLASHLVKRSYSEPQWDTERQSAVAFEKVLLFGLPIVPRRPVNFGRINAPLARELFIQHGLVEGELRTRGEFFQHNASLKSELEDWQAKLRQGGHFIGEQAEFEFYDRKLPADVWDGATFEQWRQQAETEEPRLLYLSRADLLSEPEAAPRQAAFPDKIRIGTMELPLEYHLEPGSPRDGVTLLLPPEGLDQLSEENLSWLVPGLLEEKIAALIKTLPKALRILFVPIPETARAILPLLDYGKGNLVVQLAAALRRHAGEHVPPTSFEPSRLPPHLQFNLRLVDPQGNSIAEGRDVSELRQQIRQQFQTQGDQPADPRWNRDGITDWDFGELPEQVSLQRGDVQVPAWPMLVDNGKTVSLRLAQSAGESSQQTKRGLVRMFLLSDHARIQEQMRNFPRMAELASQARPLPGGEQFRQQVAWRIAELALFRRVAIPRTPEAWKALHKQARQQIPIAVQDLAVLLPTLLSEVSHVRRMLAQSPPPALSPLIDDLREQFQQLLVSDFLTTVPFHWLQQYPRYLEGMQLRYQKATSGGFQKDRRNQLAIDPHWKRYRSALERDSSSTILPAPLMDFHFLIEEFRVSLFAQQLKTAVPVSEKKLQEAWRGLAF